METKLLSDLGIDLQYMHGQDIPVRNCWHFFSNGDDVDSMFADDEEFKHGMNTVYVVSVKYNVVILAFSLMGTHFHFVLYGSYDQCLAFIHDYTSRVSQHISTKRGDIKKLKGIRIGYQSIDNDTYLKNVICYTIKNALAAGLPYLPTHYPWSSGPLYFVTPGNWASPRWTEMIKECRTIDSYNSREIKNMLGTSDYRNYHARMIDDIVFPGDYVAYQVVEKIFRTHKAFHYFLSKNNDINENEGIISRLSLPLSELRQRRNEVIHELFGYEMTSNKLNTYQRIETARVLRKRFFSSPKQIAKSCGLIYDEVKHLL